MMKALSKAYATSPVRLQPDPLQLAVTLLRELDGLPLAARSAGMRTPSTLEKSAHAVRRHGLGGAAAFRLGKTAGNRY